MTLQKWKERKGNIMKATKEKHEKAKKKKHTKDCKNIPKTHTHRKKYKFESCLLYPFEKYQSNWIISPGVEQNIFETTT